LPVNFFFKLLKRRNVIRTAGRADLDAPRVGSSSWRDWTDNDNKGANPRGSTFSNTDPELWETMHS